MKANWQIRPATRVFVAGRNNIFKYAGERGRRAYPRIATLPVRMRELTWHA